MKKIGLIAILFVVAVFGFLVGRYLFPIVSAEPASSQKVSHHIGFDVPSSAVFARLNSELADFISQEIEQSTYGQQKLRYYVLPHSYGYEVVRYGNAPIELIDKIDQFIDERIVWLAETIDRPDEGRLRFGNSSSNYDSTAREK